MILIDLIVRNLRNNSSKALNENNHRYFYCICHFFKILYVYYIIYLQFIASFMSLFYEV